MFEDRVEGLLAADNQYHGGVLDADLQAKGGGRQRVERRIGPTAVRLLGEQNAIAGLGGEDPAALDHVGQNDHGGGVRHEFGVFLERFLQAELIERLDGIGDERARGIDGRRR